MKKLVVLFVFMSMLIVGCGSETSGNLAMSEITLTDLTGGIYSASATATYTPEGGKSPVGAEITFVAVYSTASASDTRTTKYTLSPSGIASYLNTEIHQGTEPTYLRLTAAYEGLSQTKTITIPALP